MWGNKKRYETIYVKPIIKKVMVEYNIARKTDGFNCVHNYIDDGFVIFVLEDGSKKYIATSLITRFNVTMAVEED